MAWSDMSEEEVPWYVQHARETGHSTLWSAEGQKCLVCKERRRVDDSPSGDDSSE